VLWRTWNAVIATASKTAPADQKKLLDVVQALAGQPVLKKDGKEVTIWELKVWPGLPVFGAAVREAFNVDDISDQEEQQQWINLNAFLAKLTAENALQHQGGPLDFALYGIWMLRDALEADNKSVPKYQIDVAKVWLEEAGPVLQKMSQEGRTYEGRVARPGSAYDDKDWKGFSQDRWDIWTTKVQQA